MRRQRHAKIVVTVGPSSASPDTLRGLFLAGADVFRLNFSHGTREDHARAHAAIRSLEREFGRPIAILQDLQGPKIRIGRVENGALPLAAGEVVRFLRCGGDYGGNGGRNAIPLPHPEVFDAVLPGQELLLDDGRIRLKAARCHPDWIDAFVVSGGILRDRKGVNLPGTKLPLSPLTSKDRADLAFGLDLGVDWVALSFVQTSGDILEAKSVVGDAAKLVAKIEKPSALGEIESIVRLSDAVMVARGDLGVEIPHEDVPAWQKDLVRYCRLAAKPVIIATQMLDSMVNAPTPTRAEASDVATAIYDGADAVMLSAESATGSYPVRAVTTMDRIILRTESHQAYRAIVKALEPDADGTLPHAVVKAAAELAETIGAAAIVAFTATGNTASRIARQRPQVPTLAVTPQAGVAAHLCLAWGIHSVHSGDATAYEDMVERAVFHAASEGFVVAGDRIVVVAGIPFGQAGTTNNLRVVTVERAAMDSPAPMGLSGT